MVYYDGFVAGYLTGVGCMTIAFMMILLLIAACWRKGNQ